MNSSTIEDARDKWRRRSGPFAVAFAAWLGWALAAILLILRLGEPGLLLALLLLGGLLFFSLAVLLLVIRREIWRQRRNDLGQMQRESHQMQRENLQMQELVWLSSRVSPRRPLPFPLYKTGYEAALDVLIAAWELIEQERPKRVLELGSGLSSLVRAYALEANSQGTLQSLEDSA
ncbi:MAG: hypothetical protein J4G18_14235 [Anaerolineae bacterium]|nr:hypothetical protein [Anaerolineae bacterium]